MLSAERIFGLDVSDFVLRAVALRPRRQPSVEAFQEVLLPPGLIVEGEIRQPQEVARHVRAILREAAPTPIKRKRVVACLPDRRTFIKLIHLKLRSDAELPTLIRREVPQHIPFSLDDVTLDWHVIRRNGADVSVIVGVAPKTLVTQYVATFEAADLTVSALEIESVAIARATLPDPLPDDGTLIADLGGTRTTIAVLAQRAILFSSSLPFSGMHLTQSLAQTLHLSLEDAERAKALYGLRTTVGKGAVARVLEASIQELVVAINKLIQFTTNHFPGVASIRSIILTGGGAQMPMIAEYLSPKLKLPVTIGNPLRHLSGPAQIPVHRLPSFTTAIGLALRDV